MTKQTEDLHTVVSALLSERKDITSEDIRETIEQFRASISITDQEAEEVAKEIEVKRGIRMGLGSIRPRISPKTTKENDND